MSEAATGRKAGPFCLGVSCRLTIAFGATTALLLIAVAVVQFHLSRRMLEEALRAEQRERARQTMMTLDRVLFGAQQNIVIVADERVFESLLEIARPAQELRQAVQEELESRSLTGGPWDGLHLVDASGAIVASGGARHPEALDPAEREAITSALAGTIHISDAVTLAGHDRPAILIAAPVRGESVQRSKIVGAILGHFAWPVVEELLHSSPGKTVELLDRQGRVLVRSGRLPDSGGRLTRPIVIEIHQRGFVSYRGSGWKLRVTEPAETTYAPVMKLARMLALLLGVMLMLQLAVIRMASSRLVAPLIELTAAAKRTAQGDYDVHIAEPGTAELRALAVAFNRMLTRVGEQIAVRQATEENLRRTKNFLQLAIDNVPHPLVVRDLEKGEFVLINAAASHWLEHLLPAITAMEDSLLETSAPADSGGVNIGIAGEIETFRIRALPLPEEGAGRGQALFIAENLTAERAQEKLRLEKEKAQAATRTKSDFLARMSHELRTPLNAVMGMAQILEETELNAGQRQCTEQILTSTRALLDIIEDILDISRVEAGKLTLREEPIDVGKLLKETMDLLAPMAAAKSIALELAIADEVPVEVIGDGTRLRQVVVNLLGNALKFTRRGQVSLTCALLSADSHSVHLLLSVRDTGVGIDPDEMERIFQPFDQGRAQAECRSGGTGLGLSIARTLVELMRGKLWAESTRGEGSCFWFTVRLGLRQTREETAIVPARPVPKTRPLRVLAAEDDSVNRLVIQRLLERDGHTALFAADGEAAVALAADERPDLILMDLRMPMLDGFGATAAIRAAEGAARRTPIVALTADTLISTRERCLAAGMDGFISKPIDAADLRFVLAAYSGHKGAVPCQ